MEVSTTMAVLNDFRGKSDQTGNDREQLMRIDAVLKYLRQLEKSTARIISSLEKERTRTNGKPRTRTNGKPRKTSRKRARR